MLFNDAIINGRIKFISPEVIFLFILIIFSMSYYYPYSRVLEAESALRRSRLAAEIAASRVAT